MDTITGDAASGRPEGLRRQLDELRRQNARMARSIRRQRWACVLAGVACLAVAVGGPAGLQDGPSPAGPATARGPGLPPRPLDEGRAILDRCA